MITSCCTNLGCNETRRDGRPQMTEKNNIVKNLLLLFKDIPLKRIDQYGSIKHWLKHWTHEASNEKYWNQLIKRLTHHPETPLLERPEEWGPIPSWQADTSTPLKKMTPTTLTTKMNTPPRNQPQPPPPSSQPTKQIYDPKLWLNNPDLCEMIGPPFLVPSLKILDL